MEKSINQFKSTTLKTLASLLFLIPMAAFTYTCSSAPPSSSSTATLAEAKTALNEAIAAADVAKESTEVSANGADVNPSDKWVTQAQMTALEDAIAAAQAAKSKANATQAEIESATSALNAAVKAFNAAKKAGTNPGAPTKGELEAALAAAETAKDGAEVSTDGADVFTSDKWVTSEQMDILAAQIAAAKAVKDNGSATQAEVDAAKAILQSAIATFNAARQAGTLPLCGGSKYSLASHFCDTRDGGIVYKKVDINGQVWMAENLNYNADGSKCYSNSDANCDKYGRLYNWATAMDGAASSSANPSGRQGVCPDGWHLPSDAEWTALTTFAGGTSTAGKKLKAESDLWASHATAGGTDEHGFTALPGGRGYSGNFFEVGRNGHWWSAMEEDAYNAYYRYMGYSSEGVIKNYGDKTYLYNIRCVQN